MVIFLPLPPRYISKNNYSEWRRFCFHPDLVTEKPAGCFKQVSVLRLCAADPAFTVSHRRREKGPGRPGQPSSFLSPPRAPLSLWDTSAWEPLWTTSPIDLSPPFLSVLLLGARPPFQGGWQKGRENHSRQCQ